MNMSVSVHCTIKRMNDDIKCTGSEEEINHFISLAHEILRLQGLVIKEGWIKNKYYPGQATCKIEN